MLQYKTTLLFDLDGTLTDPAAGIMKSVKYALSHYDITIEDLDSLKVFIGPPLQDSFVKYFGLSKKDADDAIWKYREYYGDKGIYECTLYPSIEKLLEGLSAQGKMLLLATSKPTVYAVKVLENFGILGRFAFVGGSELDGTRTQKDEVIAHVLSSMGITPGDRLLMLGDRSYDILGAHKNGMQALGLCYGYGSREELVQAGADYIADTVAQACALLL